MIFYIKYNKQKSKHTQNTYLYSSLSLITIETKCIFLSFLDLDYYNIIKIVYMIHILNIMNIKLIISKLYLYLNRLKRSRDYILFRLLIFSKVIG